MDHIVSGANKSMVEYRQRQALTPVVLPSYKSLAIPETKSHSFTNIFEFLSISGFAHVSAWQALRYYKQISPVGIGVDKVVDEFKALQPAIFDKTTQQYETSHKFLDFLSQPNAAISMQDFFKNYGTYYEVTGEVYLLATGNPNRPPLEISIVPPQFVRIAMDPLDGLPDSYHVNNGTVKETVFIRKEVNSRLRYFNEGDRELWHVKDFNPDASSTNFNGASKLNPIYYEIEQYLFSNRHNLSMLKRGGRLTGALISENVLDDDVYERLNQQIKESIAGADNSGVVKLFEGGLKYEEMGKSNRDMDFVKLVESIKSTIFMRLDIPLPLITPKAMTMNNLGVALVALYDNAVMPLASKLYGELTLFVGGRFGLNENQTLSVDPVTVPALQSRRLENLAVLNKLNILTDNEQRGMIGKEGYIGGDVIYKPGNLLPVGNDADTTGNRDKPATRQKFIEILGEQKDINGIRKWTDEQIYAFADGEGLK